MVFAVLGSAHWDAISAARPPHRSNAPATGPALEFLVESPVRSEDRRLLQVWFAPNYNQTHAMPFVDQRTGQVT
jgi:hypothetical protein